MLQTESVSSGRDLRFYTTNPQSDSIAYQASTYSLSFIGRDTCIVLRLSNF